jgi:hypothetical protein
MKGQEVNQIEKEVKNEENKVETKVVPEEEVGVEPPTMDQLQPEPSTNPLQLELSTDQPQQKKEEKQIKRHST